MNDQILPKYLFIPTEIEWNPCLQNLDGKVYGVIYWFYQMKNKKCFASNRQIADVLTGPNKDAEGVKKVNHTSVANSISRLAKAGYLQVVMENSHRAEIIPLLAEVIELNTTPSSIDEGYESEPLDLSSTDEAPQPIEVDTNHLQMKGNNSNPVDPSSIDDAPFIE